MPMISKGASRFVVVFRSVRVKWVCLLLLFLGVLSLIASYGYGIHLGSIPCIRAYNTRQNAVQQQRIDAIRQVAAASRAAQRKKPTVYVPSAEDLARPTSWPAVTGYLASGAGDNIPIVTYGVKDKYISYNILHHHSWENELRKNMMRIMATDKAMGLIDIGCNIGVYAVTAAKFGRRVVAVDANLYNLLMLGKSLKLSAGFEEKVTMVHNALSNEYGRVKVEVVPNNIGGSGVRKMAAPKTKTLNLKNEAESILIDDLVPMLPFRRAVMKMDIEGFEHLALAGAEQLFDKVDIVAVFMEWSGQKDNVENNKGAWAMEFIYQFFTSKGYKPYTSSGWALGSSYCLWTNDIVWKRKSNL